MNVQHTWDIAQPTSDMVQHTLDIAQHTWDIAQLICWASAPLSLIYWITEVDGIIALAPMNKFACKLHGYIVYLYLDLQCIFGF